MGRVINFNEFGEYVDFNKAFIETNPLLFFFLVETIKRVYKGKVPLYKFFNVQNDEGGHLTALMVEDACLLYANNHDEELISKLSEELEFHKFKRYNFAGTKKVIDALFDSNNATYKLIKHRIVYRCQQVISSFTYSPGEMQMADIDRLDELTKHSVAFTKEYDGQIKSYEEMQQTILNGIMKDNLYQWVYENEVCAIAQATHDNYGFPIIGHVYTNLRCRNKGYAASIVHRLTKGLLDVGNEFCMLYTDAENPASNKAFTKVGYQNTGEYIRVYKPR